MKVAILTHEDGRAFVDQQAIALRVAGHEVEIFVDRMAHALAWGDLIWCEWMRALAYETVCTNRLHERKPIVVRCHRFEAYEPEAREFPYKWTGAIVVEVPLIARRLAGLVGATPIVECPLGVDLKTFKFQQRHGPGRRFGVVGNIIPRKNLWGAMQFVAALHRPDAELHVVGESNAWDWKEMIDDIAARQSFKVVFRGRVPDVALFWSEMNYCLSAAWHETGPYAVLEAAACGVEPLVWRFPGAHEYIPAQFLWEQVYEAPALLRRPYGGLDAREWIEKKHDATKLGTQYQAAIDAACAMAAR